MTYKIDGERPKWGTHPIRCGKPRCTWRGHETDLLLVADDEIGGEVYTCPTCGNDDYMFMTEREIAAWNRKRGTV